MVKTRSAVKCAADVTYIDQGIRMTLLRSSNELQVLALHLEHSESISRRVKAKPEVGCVILWRRSTHKCRFRIVSIGNTVDGVE